VTPPLRDLTSGARCLLGIASRRWVLGGPRSVALAVTTVCNTRCVMCWSHSPLLEDEALLEPRFMEREVFEQILRQCRELGTFRVVVCGDGDPALHPDCDEMLTLANELGMVPYVMTNGLALDGDRVERWSHIRAHFRFSMHAGDAATWQDVHCGGNAAQFDRVSQVIRALAAAGTPHVSTMHVLHKHNFRHVRAMVEHARELGVGEILFRPTRVDATTPLLAVALDPDEEAWLLQELAECLKMAREWGIRTNLADYLATNLFIRSGRLETTELYRKIPCYVGWLYAELAIDGTMTPCIHSSRIMGRVGEERIADVWRSRRYQELRRECLSLPRRGRPVSGCNCDSCCMAKYNLNVHNLLHLRSMRYGEA